MKQLIKSETHEKTLSQKETKISTKEIVCVGMFAAVLAVLSQIAIPMPSGVPITLQTFAIALTGVVLAWKLGVTSTLVYILLGAVGVPVFSGFSGGLHVLVNYTGGFIWGFIVLAFLSGVGITLKNKFLGVLLGFVGLAICHLFGSLQFMVVMKMSFLESFLLASAPYLIKDAISVILAFAVGLQIRSRLLRAGLLS
ncbi:MAG: biotin transporter BioY [Lachnospiraceae bacterium]|nr:biotin transporter BioY [Lachnospiraceae bacterium]